MPDFDRNTRSIRHAKRIQIGPQSKNACSSDTSAPQPDQPDHLTIQVHRPTADRFRLRHVWFNRAWLLAAIGFGTQLLGDSLTALGPRPPAATPRYGFDHISTASARSR